MNVTLPISVSIIASNEEGNLKRLLPSIAGFAEEIILVYNDCSDGTVEVAKSYGVLCFEEKWYGYKEQKNLAIQKCTKEWILCMDADEVLSDKLKQSIISFLRNSSSSNYNGACFNRCSFFMGKWIRHGDWYPDRKNRLFRASMGGWQGGQLHEHLEIKGNVYYLEGDLLHYSYDTILDFPKKISLYGGKFAEQKNRMQSKVSRFELWARPSWRFVRAYFFRLGFLDGVPGFVIAMSSAYECLIRYGHLLETASLGQSKKG